MRQYPSKWGFESSDALPGLIKLLKNTSGLAIEQGKESEFLSVDQEVWAYKENVWTWETLRRGTLLPEDVYWMSAQA